MRIVIRKSLFFWQPLYPEAVVVILFQWTTASELIVCHWGKWESWWDNSLFFWGQPLYPEASVVTIIWDHPDALIKVCKWTHNLSPSCGWEENENRDQTISCFLGNSHFIRRIFLWAPASELMVCHRAGGRDGKWESWWGNPLFFGGSHFIRSLSSLQLFVITLSMMLWS